MYLFYVSFFLNIYTHTRERARAEHARAPENEVKLLYTYYSRAYILYKSRSINNYARRDGGGEGVLVRVVPGAISHEQRSVRKRFRRVAAAVSVARPCTTIEETVPAPAPRPYAHNTRRAAPRLRGPLCCRSTSHSHTRARAKNLPADLVERRLRVSVCPGNTHTR